MKITLSLLCSLLLMVCLSAGAVQPATVLGDASRGFFDLSSLEKLSTEEINKVHTDGSTLLLWAAHYDNTDVVLSLLALGAQPNTYNLYSVGALHEAARNGNQVVVKALLDKGANIHHLIAGNETPLMTAARTGVVDSLITLIDYGADINAVTVRGQTALMWAAAEGHDNIVQILLDNKADPNIASNIGMTALLYASRAGHWETITNLLDAGVDINFATIKPKKYKTAPKGSSALLIAIHNAHFGLAAKLIKAGADTNDLRSGISPLHHLVSIRKPDIGDNSDPPPPGSGAMTSLDLVDVFIEHGADPNIAIKSAKAPNGASIHLEGATPLLLASKTADMPYIKRLIKHGADVDTKNIDGVTPLMMAAGLGTQAADEEAGSEPEALELVSFLLQTGANIDEVSLKGDTAMHGAAYKNFPEVVRQLDTLGADITIWNTKNQAGWTPLLIAQGFRPGNYKPSAKTEAAFAEVMIAKGYTPPPAPSRTKKKTYLE